MANLANLPLSQTLLKLENRNMGSIARIISGIAFISILARISIPLPFSPVPLTGQTFGVFLISLTFGRKMGALTVLSYLGLGFAGLPIFSAGTSGLTGGLLGPTSGYLMGMLFA